MPEIVLPTLHAGQVEAFKIPGRRKVIRCGRRWGKSVFGVTIACDGAAKGEPVGYFTPAYKYQLEIFNDCRKILEPIVGTSSKVDGLIHTATDGRVEFWTLENENAGRSRRYKKVIIDEAAFAKPTMMEIWERSIEPTLLDYSGTVYVLSNTNGVDSEQFFWKICNEPKHGFVEYHAPSKSNPTIPQRLLNETHEQWIERRDREFAELKARKPPLVWAQEYEAEFVDWSGAAFFSREAWLVNEQPVAYPDRCEAVFAVIDTAVKSGKENDCTAVVYFSMSRYTDYPLVILDYDAVQIDGSLLEQWLPTVYQRLEALARATGALRGTLGAWIEDKASGTILLQQAARRGWPAMPIDTHLTALGKDERAISVSGYHYEGKCKISQFAHDKVINVKESSRNHLMTQVLGFRIGDKEAYKRADDLADCYMYGLSIALGDSEGN